MDDLVIVGSGLAAVTLVREVRRRDPQRAITLVTRDSGEVYSKPGISGAYAAGKTADGLVTQDARAHAEAMRLRLLAYATVQALDVGRRVLHTDQGDIGWRDLVLAIGASPVRLTVSGDGAVDVRAVNSLDDYRALRARLTVARRVAIIGAGLVGCELANDLRTGGHAVTLYDRAPRPLSRLLPEAAARRMGDALVDAGVEWRPGVDIARIDRAGEQSVIHTSDGRCDTFDVVLSALGLTLDAPWVTAAGIATGAGLQVDAGLQTSQAHVFALGDCVETDGRLMPYVQPILHGAKALAATLCGDPTAVVYPPMPVVIKTPACPTVVCAPEPGQSGRWSVEGEDADGLCATFVDDGGVMRGFVLQGSRTRERMAMAARIGVRL